MLGVIGLFDEKTEQKIKTIWRELSENSISFYAEEVVDRVPHLTFAGYEAINKQDLIRRMERIYDKTLAIQVSFNSLGSFLKSGAIYLAPVVTKELLDFHERHHKCFARFNNDPDSLYSPGNWIPHCTLANRLAEDKLMEAYHYCLTTMDKIEGRITRIAVIEMVDKSHAPVIFTRELQRV